MDLGSCRIHCGSKRFADSPSLGLVADLYDWPPFIIAPGFSVIGMLLMAGLENLIGVQLLGQYDLEAQAAAREQGPPEEEADLVKPVKLGEEGAPHPQDLHYTGKLAAP